MSERRLDADRTMEKGRPAAEPLSVTIVPHEDPNARERWLVALQLLLEAGRQPEDADR